MYLVNHRFTFTLLLTDRLDLRIPQPYQEIIEAMDLQPEEDLYDKGLLKEAIVNDACQTTKNLCSTAMLNTTITPR